MIYKSVYYGKSNSVILCFLENNITSVILLFK